MMEVNEAKRLKELERENTELKKMLADSLLENRVLRFVNEKIMGPGHKKQMAQTVVPTACVPGGEPAASCVWREPRCGIAPGNAATVSMRRAPPRTVASSMSTPASAMCSGPTGP